MGDPAVTVKNKGSDHSINAENCRLRKLPTQLTAFCPQIPPGRFAKLLSTCRPWASRPWASPAPDTTGLPQHSVLPLLKRPAEQHRIFAQAQHDANLALGSGPAYPLQADRPSGANEKLSVHTSTGPACPINAKSDLAIFEKAVTWHGLASRGLDKSFPDKSRLDAMLLLQMEGADEPPVHRSVRNWHHIKGCHCRNTDP